MLQPSEGRTVGHGENIGLHRGVHVQSRVGVVHQVVEPGAVQVAAGIGLDALLGDEVVETDIDHRVLVPLVAQPQAVEIGIADRHQDVRLALGDRRRPVFVAGAQLQTVVDVVLHAHGPAPGIAVAAVEGDAVAGGVLRVEVLGDAQQVELAVELDLELVPVAVAVPFQVEVELPLLERAQLHAGGEGIRIDHVHRGVAMLFVDVPVGEHLAEDRTAERLVHPGPETLPALAVVDPVLALEPHPRLALVGRAPGEPVGGLPEHAEVEAGRKRLLHVQVDIGQVLERTDVAAADVEEHLEDLLHSRQATDLLGLLQQPEQLVRRPEILVQRYCLVGETHRQADRQLVVDLVGQGRREVGEPLQRHLASLVARRIAIGIAAVAQRLRGVDVGGEGELGTRRVDRDPGQRRHQQRHVGHAAEAGQVHGRGQGPAVAVGDRVVAQAEGAFAVVRRRLEAGADVHYPGEQLHGRLAALHLGQRRRVVVHRIDAGLVGGHGVAEGHGFRVADGQVVGHLRAGRRNPGQAHPCQRQPERRNAHLHNRPRSRVTGPSAL